MTLQRILGHVLLWTGFLGAALATVSQREFDLLPSSEREILSKLDDKLSIAKAELQKLNSTPIEKMNETELKESVERVNAWNAGHQKVINELKKENEQIEDEKNKKPIPQQVHPKSKLDLITMRTARLGNLWSTVVWPWYGVAMLVAVVGVFLLRASNRSLTENVEHAAGQFSTLTTSANELVAKLQTLDEKFDSMVPEEVVEYIDDQCVLHFSDFADSRNTITTRYGLNAFAAVMSEFATGERYINRAWSASADGYMDEAKSSVKRSLSHLVKVRKLLDEYEKK